MKHILLALVILGFICSCGKDNIITHNVPSPPDTVTVVDTVTVTPCSDCHHHRHCRGR